MDNNQGGGQATANKHGIEVMKQMLLPSMSEDMKGVPKLLKESAGESSCCIFRVPEAVAGVNAAACWPCTVSIGPYHHGKPALQMLEEHKWRYLRAMLDRMQPCGLEDLIGKVGRKEETIRHCYSESTERFSGPDFVKMMVLDGCFIIELLLRRVRSELSEPDNRPPEDPVYSSVHELLGSEQSYHDDPLLRNSYLFTSLVRDLLRLENQVPYFVLEDLFAIAYVPKVTLTLVDLASRVFTCYLKEPCSDRERQGNVKGMHLLDSFRLTLIPQGRRNKRMPPKSIRSFSNSFTSIESASDYRRMGIKFKPNFRASTLTEVYLDVKNQVIRIPTLRIDDTVKCILLNMVAFEQCHGHCDKHVTAYAMFMGRFIQTKDDAKILSGQLILQNRSVSDVAQLFRDVCKDASCESQADNQEREIGITRWFMWKAVVRDVYHSNPEVFISVITLLVTLSGVIQTVYALLQYYQPN